MADKVYCGTRASVLEQLRADYGFRPVDDRVDASEYPYHQDGLSGVTIEDQLGVRGVSSVMWITFTRETDGSVIGMMSIARVRVLS